MKFCEKIVAVDNRIRFAGLFEGGSIIEWAKNLDIKLIMSQSEIESILAALVPFSNAIVRQWSKYFGKFEHQKTSFEKLNLYIFKGNEKTILITTQREFPNGAITKVKEIIKRQFEK